MTQPGDDRFGLPRKALERLVGMITARAGVQRVLLYGSRAMGNHRPGSDIDICLVAPTMTLSELMRLDNDIDDLLLPWKVDLTMLHRIDNTLLREHIERAGIDLSADVQPGPGN